MHKLHTSGVGNWNVYFETGTIAAKDKELHIIRRPTMKAAKVAALAQASAREIPHVHVMRGGLSKWCTCAVTPTIERKCMGA